MFRRLAITVPVLVLLFNSVVEGAYIYSLRFDKPYYVVNESGEVEVNLRLREVTTASETPRLQSSPVSTGNVQVLWNSGGAYVASDSHVTFGPGFNVTNLNPVSSPTATLAQSADFGLAPGSPGIEISSTIYEANLGKLKFTMPLGPFTKTPISFQDVAGSSNLVIGWGSFTIDESTLGYGTAIVANPEPSALAMSGLGTLGLFGALLIRRRVRGKWQPLAAV